MNDFINNMSVILPSYKPDEKLLAVLDGLSKKGFSDIIVVNGHPQQHFLFCSPHPV